MKYCHCGHFQDCNKFWDDLMFGRYRCKRNDFHECCCKRNRSVSVKNVIVKQKRNAIVGMKRKNINNKNTIRTLFWGDIFHLEQISLQLTMCLSF